MMNEVDPQIFLPHDGFVGTLIGRAWVPSPQSAKIAGPSPVLISEEGVFDLSRIAPTCAELLGRVFP